MPLTPEQRTAIDEWAAKVRGICPSCGRHGEAELHADILRIPSATGGRGCPILLIACPKCGHAQHFSAVVLGFADE